MDYSKIKYWTAGEPDELESGMVLDTWKVNPAGKYRYKLIGDLTWIGNGATGCSKCLVVDEIENFEIIRWAWLPGFEPTCQEVV